MSKPTPVASRVETVLLIAECGARWESLAQTVCRADRQLSLIIQAPHEPLEAFRDRVDLHLVRLIAVHCMPELILVAPAPRPGQELAAGTPALCALPLAWARRGGALEQ